MKVLIISQCTKAALTETRRVLDQFAERTGDRAWSTSITQIGLQTLTTLLKKNARRNTAVACHWQKKDGSSELLWIIGNQNRFDATGRVPSYSTSRNILKASDEDQWQTGEIIAVAAGIAGLFHDFGKASQLFQDKLKGKKSGSKSYEPYRHEWISLCLFKNFVELCQSVEIQPSEREGENETLASADRKWLTQLQTLSVANVAQFEQQMIQLEPQKIVGNLLAKLPAFAQWVAWLIVSHHRLPTYQQNNLFSAPKTAQLSLADEDNRFHVSWNSPQFLSQDWQEKDFKLNTQFPYGTPLLSQTWRIKANKLATRALKQSYQLKQVTNWFTLEHNFSTHLARLSLMLADHAYSSMPAQTQGQDKQYQAYANTDKTSKALKQKLDEHNLGVAHHSYLIAKSLPRLKQSLPAISRHKGFKKRSKDPKYQWQDKTYDLAVSVQHQSQKQGFFGINMASTGCGKTFANAKIMYGLSHERQGCRFHVALGLRTLTLQTGDAYREKLNLTDDDLAVLLGSSQVQTLHQLAKKQEQQQKEVQEDLKLQQTLEKNQGYSESSNDFFDEQSFVRYDAAPDCSTLRRWMKQESKTNKLLSAPIVVSTIDQLIAATDGIRGGRQIAPMLRLLTSDLVLDEPDDFDLADMPALCRLVNWAGMLGSRVLISSATLPPALIQALFLAYQAGRQSYHHACINQQGACPPVICAWFDEFKKPVTVEAANPTDFKEAHQQFVSKRLIKLAQKPQQHQQVELLPWQAANQDIATVIPAMATAIKQGMLNLHQAHHQIAPTALNNKRVSFGLVRMANINPLVAVSQQLLASFQAPDTRIHYVIYHSQHPLMVRSHLENNLDRILARHQPEQIWQEPTIQKALSEHQETNHLFVVFATAVAEVGRDHDYDWAVVEPSSMRSIIQLAGRLRRHRQGVISQPNILLLSQNYRAATLEVTKAAYCKPGFELDEGLKLTSHDLQVILEKEQYMPLTAAPRVQMRPQLSPFHNLVDLEHMHTVRRLFGGIDKYQENYAGYWWQQPLHWNGCFQQQTRFRQSTAGFDYVFYYQEEESEYQIHRFDEFGQLIADSQGFQAISVSCASQVSAWFDLDYNQLLIQLAERLAQGVEQTSQQFAQINLRPATVSKRWQIETQFGIYQLLS